MELLTSHAAGTSSPLRRAIYDNGMMLQQGRTYGTPEKNQERHTQEIGWLKEEVHSLFESLLDAWARGHCGDRGKDS
ncbi:hypothetical protein J4Q44_G00252020 [Coregonus suidteri]|uniref:Uncharacterized protein n=1 Tax=Coregonus suidteri TaxID=861788 RepID=A0AAN8LJC7_9TELE